MYAADLGRVNQMNEMGGMASGQRQQGDTYYDPRLKKTVRKGRTIG